MKYNIEEILKIVSELRKWQKVLYQHVPIDTPSKKNIRKMEENLDNMLNDYKQEKFKETQREIAETRCINKSIIDKLTYDVHVLNKIRTILAQKEVATNNIQYLTEALFTVSINTKMSAYMLESSTNKKQLKMEKIEKMVLNSQSACLTIYKGKDRFYMHGSNAEKFFKNNKHRCKDVKVLSNVNVREIIKNSIQENIKGLKEIVNFLTEQQTISDDDVYELRNRMRDVAFELKIESNSLLSEKEKIKVQTIKQ